MTQNTRISTPGTLDQHKLNVAFYLFVELDGLERRRAELLEKAKALGIYGSILLSPEGINAFLAGEDAPVREFVAYLRAKAEFAKIEPKESWSTHVPFSRMLVKLKKEIITMGRPDLTPSRFTGKHLKAAELKKWLDDKRKDVVLVDTRNTYEIAEGTFKGAIHYGIETFKEFPEALAKHKAELEGKQVVMFCTGGIRCEKATALAMEYGLKDVYQLDGGILKYFEEEGGAHYRGDCFVFDGRETVDPKLAGEIDRQYVANIGTLTLHSYRRCPYAIRVRMTLEEKKLPFTIIEEKLSEPSADLLRHNPHGSVPVLIHRGHSVNGEVVLRESAVITEYLDELFPNVPLMPKGPERRARVRLWTAWITNEFKADLDAWKYERPKLSDEARFELDERMIRYLFHVQGALQRRPYLVSKEMTLADIHVFPFIRQFHRAVEALPEAQAELRATLLQPVKLAKLWSWYASIEERPSFVRAMAKLGDSSEN